MKEENFATILNRNLDRNSETKPGDKLQCKHCNEEFVRGDWCFHQLCTRCFIVFDEQKMQARFGGGQGTEDVEKWVRSMKN